jgi:hypothetical protein
MPQIRTHRSTDDLRPVYRALGLSEETIARAIQYSKIAPPDERPSPELERRRGRPRQKVRILGQPASKPKLIPEHNRRSRNILPKEGTEKRGAG